MSLLNHKAIINSHSNVVNVVDIDGNTNSRYYTPFWASVSGTAYFNKWPTVTVHDTTSTMTVMEVAA